MGKVHAQITELLADSIPETLLRIGLTGTKVVDSWPLPEQMRVR